MIYFPRIISKYFVCTKVYMKVIQQQIDENPPQLIIVNFIET